MTLKEEQSINILTVFLAAIVMGTLIYFHPQITEYLGLSEIKLTTNELLAIIAVILLLKD